MKKKEIIIITAAVLLLCVIATTGCTRAEKNLYGEEKKYETEETSEMETGKEELISKEYLFENTELKPEDFEEYGFDPDDFIKVYSLTEHSEELEEIMYWYDGYVYYHTEHPETNDGDYDYLVASPLNLLDEDMIEQIKTVFVYRLTGGCGEIFVFDFGNKRICKTSTCIREAKEADRKKIIDIIKRSKLLELKETDYRRGSKVDKYGYEEMYELVIESEDGRIAHYKGEGSVPNEILPLVSFSTYNEIIYN